jgi:hypothetical protein
VRRIQIQQPVLEADDLTQPLDVAARNRQQPEIDAAVEAHRRRSAGGGRSGRAAAAACRQDPLLNVSGGPSNVRR